MRPRRIQDSWIATGEIEDVTTEDGKNAAAVAHGRQGAGRRHERQAADC